jgi:hypothetical protein
MDDQVVTALHEDVATEENPSAVRGGPLQKSVPNKRGMDWNGDKPAWQAVGRAE